MHNLGNNKALKKLAGIKGLWIAKHKVLTVKSMVQVMGKSSLRY